MYDLAARYKLTGSRAFCARKPGRPRQVLHTRFVKKVVDLRKSTEYGSAKLHYVLCKTGFSVSRRQIQNVLDSKRLTVPCVKRRGKRTYVRFEWPISNYMWHTDWSKLGHNWYCAFLDDKSRKIMAAGVFKVPTTRNTLFLLHQAILAQEVCPSVILSDKGAQFYANKHTKKGKRAISEFEHELTDLGIELWTSRRRHPQTNGKMEKWFDTMKQALPRFKNDLHAFVVWYNAERIHCSLDYKTPDEVYHDNV